MLERHRDKAQTTDKVQDPVPHLHAQNAINNNPIKLRIQILNQREQDDTIDKKDSIGDIPRPIIRLRVHGGKTVNRHFQEWD
jgi:hypothetical protein